MTMAPGAQQDQPPSAPGPPVSFPFVVFFCSLPCPLRDPKGEPRARDGASPRGLRRSLGPWRVVDLSPPLEDSCTLLISGGTPRISLVQTTFQNLSLPVHASFKSRFRGSRSFCSEPLFFRACLRRLIVAVLLTPLGKLGWYQK